MLHVKFPIVVLIMIITFSSVMISSAWSQSTPPDIQVAAAVATILYFPFKAAFALGGGIVGGLAYVVSGFNEPMAKSIWIPSTYGTYVIAPEHLGCDRAVHFWGVADESEGIPSTPAAVHERVE